MTPKLENVKTAEKSNICINGVNGTVIKQCFYKCKYYQDGAVYSLCNKYDAILKYSGSPPPLRVSGCNEEQND